MANYKILIVEDEAIVAMHLRRQLSKLNFNVLPAVGKGEKAVLVSKDEKPDIVIMDVGLATKMSGIEAAREILTHCSPLFIFTTGYADELLSEQIKSMRGVLLPKPVDVKEIIHAINNFISK